MRGNHLDLFKIQGVNPLIGRATHGPNPTANLVSVIEKEGGAYYGIQKRKCLQVIQNELVDTFLLLTILESFCPQRVIHGINL